MSTTRPEPWAFEEPEAPAWIKKRDHSVVAFDAGKLASSLLGACETAGTADPAFRAQEFARVVLHFLAEEVGGRIPTTADIAEIVQKVLREIDQAPVATAFMDYRVRRERLAKPPEELDIGPEDKVGSEHPHFDKARLAANLEEQSELDPTTARAVAAAVERQLLALNLPRVPKGLVRQLVDSELAERGLDSALARRGELAIPVEQAQDLVDSAPNAETLARALGGALLERFALREVYSADVARLHDDRLLRIYGLDRPTCPAAITLNVRAIAPDPIQAESWLARLRMELLQRSRDVGGAIALVGLDTAVAQFGDRGLAMIEPLRAVLEEVLAERSITLVLNLGIAAMMAEPGKLFSGAPAPPVRAVDSAALEIARAALALESSRILVDLHPEIESDDEDLERQLKPWAQLARRHGSFRLVIARGAIPLAEGLFERATDQAVAQYVGIRLPTVLDRLGPGADEETFSERLGLLCEAAVRAAVQQREFLRRCPGALRPSSSGALVLVPIGLDACVRQMIGRAMAADDAAGSFAQQILGRLLQRLRREARHFQLPCSIDGIPWVDEVGTDPALVAGVTPALAGPGPRQQIATGGGLCRAVSAGTTWCLVPEDFDPPVDDWVDLWIFAIRQTKVIRLGFRRPEPLNQPPLDANWLR